MAQPERISHFSYSVEPFCDDFRGFLSWATLGNQLLRAAQTHASRGGFGFEQMMEIRHVWVLSRLIIEVEQLPRIGEAYAIETWVDRVYRQFTDRHFAVLDAQGTPIGYADSVWALISLDTRLPLDLTTLPNGGFTPLFVPERHTNLAPPTRARMRNGEKMRDYRVQYSDLDVNGHLNSIRYLTLLLDVLAESVHERPDVKRVELSFAGECYFGETLEIYHELLPNESGHLFEIRKQTDGSTAFKAILS